MYKPILLALAAGLLLPSMALTLRTAEPTSVQEDSDDEFTPLQTSMMSLKRGQRALKKLIKEPAVNQGKLMETLTSMERATMIALGEMPPEPEGLENVDLDLWHIGFRQKMTELLVSILSMEDATLRTDTEALAAAYKALGQIKKSGHEEIRDN